MFMQKIIFISSGLIFFFIVQNACAQAWHSSTDKSGADNFFQLRDNFNTYWKDKNPEKGSGYKVFRRWEHYWAPRVDKNGNFPQPGALMSAWDKYKSRQNPNPKRLETQETLASGIRTQAANWTCIGPFHSPGGYTGMGRLNTIAFHPTNPSVYFVGSPAGGLWQTTNDGLTWFTHTDDLPSLGVSAIVVDYNNPDHIYIGTGDGDEGALAGLNGISGGDTRSIGVLKSTDGGLSFQPTGLSWITQQGKLITRMQQHPTHPFVLIVAASDGLYRTSDAGMTWLQVQTGNFRDVEVSPLDSSHWYAATYDKNGGASVFTSLDNGQNWSMVQTFPNVNRINIAVIPANGEVHLLCSSATDNGFGGLYKSATPDIPNSFVVYRLTPNILGWNPSGSGNGGQGMYDLAFTADPNDSTLLYVGGVNLWKINLATNLANCITMWIGGSSNPGNLPVVHADHHFLDFQMTGSNPRLFTCNDGGLYRSLNQGASWLELTHSGNGPVIGQFYRIATSDEDPNLMLGGLQDNGTIRRNINGWQFVEGGDGMECHIDPADTAWQYMSTYFGITFRSSNGGQTFQNNIYANIPGSFSGAWVAPSRIHPHRQNQFILALDEIFVSSNRGDTWQQRSSGQSQSKAFRSLAISESNPDLMIAATFDTVLITTDYGLSWQSITPTVFTGNITYITIDPVDPNRIWLCLSDYSGGARILFSSDQGLNWSDFSGTLPDVPVNCMVYTKGSNDALYIGTDLGVFYRDASMNDWIAYADDLPVVVVTELEILYNFRKIRAATFGRGIWEADIYEAPPAAPLVDFTCATPIICEGDIVSFQENTSGGASQWSWSFPGGTPSASTLPNPNVTYSQKGTYTVSLTATNSQGADFRVKTAFIRVGKLPVPAPVISGVVCEGGTLQLSHPLIYGMSYLWQGPNGFSSSTSQSVRQAMSPSDAGMYSVTITYPGCPSVLDSILVSVNPLPVAPVLPGNSGPVCAGSSVSLSAQFPMGSTSLWKGPMGFQNLNPNPVITSVGLANAGLYSAYALASGCTSQVSTTTLQVFPTPPMPVISQNGNILSASQPDGNQWFYNALELPGENQQTLDIALYGSGAYTVQLTNSDNCKSFMSNIKTAYVLNITEPVQACDFSLWPNPGTDEISLKVTGTLLSDKAFLRIYSVNGILLKTFPLISRTEQKIPVQGLSKGMYLLKIEDEEHVFPVHKLMIP